MGVSCVEEVSCMKQNQKGCLGGTVQNLVRGKRETTHIMSHCEESQSKEHALALYAWTRPFQEDSVAVAISRVKTAEQKTQFNS